MSHGNNRSSNLTKKGKYLETPISNDLIIDIFSRLPGKSIARFYCLSKLWCSMLHHPHFTDLFFTRSSSRPRLLFVLEEAGNEWSIFSSPQPQNPYDNSSSLVVAADFHMKFHAEVDRKSCSYASGLIYFPDVWISRGDDEDKRHVICNPITGQYAILPIRHRRVRSVLGFDPIDKQFKVLVEALPFPYRGQGRTRKILTLGLGTGKLNWKATKNRCPSYDYSFCEGICINGVWYYLVQGHSNEQIVCVYVRSEEFKIIDAKCFRGQDRVKLIHYKGRLGGISWKCAGNTLELCMCVLEDDEKQEWSKHVYNLGEKVGCGNHFVVGMTSTGEIVVSMQNTSDDKPFYVHYFNPERNTLQSVEIKGFEKGTCRVYAFVDHVEDLNVNDAKDLKRRSPAKQGLYIKNHKNQTTCEEQSADDPHAE